MTRSEINHQISSYQTQIDSCYRQIQEQQARLDRLLELKSKHQKVLADHYCLQDSRTSQYNYMANAFPQIRFAKAQSDVMLELLRSNEATRAGKGIEDSIEVIKQEIRRSEDKIDDLNRRILGYNNSISNLRYQLRYAED